MSLNENEHFLNLKSGKWFAEINSQWPGQAFMLQYDEILYSEKSKFQDIKIIKTKKWGKALLLDNVIQLTERDEFAYQEMMAHCTLFRHKSPKKILILGGGDGMVLREIFRHEGVEKVVLCEIDEAVIKTCKKFFPLKIWSDSRAEIICEDAAEFVKRKENRGEFDVIICDSSDPVGPAESLFNEEYYRNLSLCLRENGVACFQAEDIWISTKFAASLLKKSKRHFKFAKYGTIQIPTYPCGQIGFILCSNFNIFKAENLPRKCPFSLKYYNDKIAESAFVLPSFVLKEFEGNLGEKNYRG